jgi:hypothetical protein
MQPATFARPLAREHAAPEATTLALDKASGLAGGAMAASGLVLTTQGPGNVTGRITAAG